MRELTEHYTRIRGLDVVLTFAVAQHRTAAELVGLYGGNPEDSPCLLSTVEAESASFEDLDERAYVQIIETSGYTVALENNSAIGTLPETACHASEGGGYFLSIHWNGNGVYRITAAKDGVLTGSFEPTFGATAVAPDDLVPDWATGMEFDPSALRTQCLAVVEQQTGVVFEQEWLVKKLSTYKVSHDG